MFSKEELDIIKGMCDLTLKHGGLQNLDAVLKILKTIQENEATPKVTTTPKAEKKQNPKNEN